MVTLDVGRSFVVGWAQGARRRSVLQPEDTVSDRFHASERAAALWVWKRVSSLSKPVWLELLDSRFEHRRAGILEISELFSSSQTMRECSQSLELRSILAM